MSAKGRDGRGKRNEMNAAKPVIRNAATLILVAKNGHLKSYFDYRILLLERGTKSQFMVCTLQALIMYRSKPPIPPGQTPRHLAFLKNFGQIPRYVASLDGQMPHPLELQGGQISHPPGMLKQLWKQVLQNFQPLEISC